jgi:hypothetical protein
MTTNSPPSPPLALGQQSPSSAIPWSDVGPGWSLALSTSPGASSAVLSVIDPSGGRYTVTSAAPLDASIAGWSGDKTRALLVASTGGGTALVSQVDLTDGATLDHFAPEPALGQPTYSLPTGMALLDIQTNPPGNPEVSLVRLDLTGSTELTYPTRFPGGIEPSPGNPPDFLGPYLETPDGTEIVMASNAGMAVVSNDGTLVRDLAPPTEGACAPVEWWRPGVVLAGCVGGLSPQNEYWLVPISGGPPTVFGPLARAGSDDEVSLAQVSKLWQVGGAVYAQSDNGCESIVKLASGAWQPASVPGAASGTYAQIVGTYGDQLELLTAPGSCSNPGPISLRWSDPTTGATTVLLGPPLTPADFVTAEAYPNTEN